MLIRFLVALALVALGTPALADPVGSRFQVNTGVSGDQGSSSVAPLNTGGFVVTWYTDNVADEGIHGQIYDAQGKRLGAEFQISTKWRGVQKSPSVAGLGNGGFVVTWASFEQDGNAYGIYGQRYDAVGKRAGIEFRVNTTTRWDEGHPSVAALKDGGFVVIWESLQAGASQQIYGQRYNATGARVGGQFKVNKAGTDSETLPKVAGLLDGLCCYVVFPTTCWSNRGSHTRLRSAL